MPRVLLAFIYVGTFASVSLTKSQKAISDRLANWLIYSVLFATIPLVVGIILGFVGLQTGGAAADCNEYLFFSLTLSATTLSETRRITKYIREGWFTAMNGITLFLGFIVAITYGMLLLSNAASKGQPLFSTERLLILSKLLGAAILVFALMAQILIAKIEGGVDEGVA